MNECTLCDTIISMENALDKKAEALTNKVKEILRPTIEYNNNRWAIFSKYCSIPLLGELVFGISNTPASLKKEVSFWKFDWYNKEGKNIEQEARELEKLKQRDIMHWGEELVKTDLPGDPSDYYHPTFPIRRKDCLDVAYVQFMKDRCLTESENRTSSIYDGRVSFKKLKSNLEKEIKDNNPDLEHLDGEFRRYMGMLKLSGKEITNTEKYTVDIPDKYSFTWGYNFKKFDSDKKVMDSWTKNIIHFNDSNWTGLNNKMFYFLKPSEQSE